MAAEGEATLTVEQLAQATGMSVRNIRNHQSRGLLPPPELEARTGYYGEAHLERLREIRRMQAEGFNLEAIRCLLGGAAETPAVAPAELAERCGVSPAAARHAAVATRAVAALFDRALER